MVSLESRTVQEATNTHLGIPTMLVSLAILSGIVDGVIGIEEGDVEHE